MASFRQIDIERWPRRHLFEFFRAYDLPFWQVTVPVDVTRLRQWSQSQGHSFFLACLWLWARAANAVPELRQRLRPEGVIEWDVVHPGATLMHDDRSFTFCYFDYEPDLDHFCRKAKAHMEAHLKQKAFAPRTAPDDVLHCSVLPWLPFTGFQNARRLNSRDAVPKIVWGKAEVRATGWQVPLSIEVHHALVDGYHVGLFFQQIEMLQAQL